MRLSHAFSFQPLPVAAWTLITYLIFLIPSVVVHETVPPAPKNADQPLRGVNATEAWLDLLTLTNKYHPFPSRRNEELYEWLLGRVQTILDRNGVSYTNSSIGGIRQGGENEGEDNQPPAVYATGSRLRGSYAHGTDIQQVSTGPAATIFRDTISNVSMATFRVQNASWTGNRQQALGLYFEGMNIFVYIRGTEDDDGEWWTRDTPPSSTGVLVNSHMDSVATGYGTSDDGIAVVTVLQLISYFTTPGQQPKHGIVAMINDGEEDGLWGSRTLGYHPILPFIRTFTNLEGAGANSRALLFRASDKEVTGAYSSVPNPFGSVVASDGFRLRIIKSDTDFSVFTRVYGQRGVDIAFYRPRARYHTNQDDVSHSSLASMWHMMESGIMTVKSMANAPENQFAGNGTDGVWFDTFGNSFSLMSLTSVFGWAVAMLVVSPITLAAITVMLIRADKYYLFSGRFQHRRDAGSVSVNGWNGFFRYPIALIVAILAVIVAGFIVVRGNPFVVYGNEYTVWVMSLSIFFFAFWAVSARATLSQSTYLHRAYATFWLYGITWALLIPVAYLLGKSKIGAGFSIVIIHTLMFGAALVSLGELFFLPPKSIASHMLISNPDGIESSHGLNPTMPLELVDPLCQPGEDANEERLNGPKKSDPRTPLIQRLKHLPRDEVLLWKGGRGKDEAWAEGALSWTWLLQLWMICPATVVFACSIGLLVSSSVAQTGSDGSGVVFPILAISVFSIFLMIPATPFIHRMTWHLPTFFLLVFMATFIYNLAAFPFSANSRYKAFFQQAVDLDTGISAVRIGGIEKYVRPMIAKLPSATGKTVRCGITAPPRTGIVMCEYDGSAVMPNITKAATSGKERVVTKFSDWLSFNISRKDGANKARFSIDAANSKGCQLRFDRPISNFAVVGNSGLDERFGDLPDTGLDQIKLWRRDWDKVWEVDVEWDDAFSLSSYQRNSELDLTGRVVCIWADANIAGTIPALEEIFRFAPPWSTVTKLLEGLVEGSKSFSV
ncbi:hypothetical protein GQ53DRAFT_889425 [Thozetella sp. PMI_491]|nr:hypothetical protein GQ53DRAFT_889425 [Thozetella sp. PMI_491]